jgi:hypothetical protein
MTHETAQEAELNHAVKAFFKGFKKPTKTREALQALDEQVSRYADDYSPLRFRDEVEAAIFDKLADDYGITTEDFEA